MPKLNEKMDAILEAIFDEHARGRRSGGGRGVIDLMNLVDANRKLSKSYKGFRLGIPLPTYDSLTDPNGRYGDPNLTHFMPRLLLVVTFWCNASHSVAKTRP